MDDHEEEHLEDWLEDEVLPKIEHIEKYLEQRYEKEEVELLLPTIAQMSITPQYYYEKEVDRRRDELLSRLKSRLKKDEARKKFTEFIHDEDIPYKMGAKPEDVASSLNNDLLSRALKYLKREE